MGISSSTQSSSSSKSKFIQLKHFKRFEESGTVIGTVQNLPPLKSNPAERNENLFFRFFPQNLEKDYSMVCRKLLEQMKDLNATNKMRPGCFLIFPNSYYQDQIQELKVNFQRKEVLAVSLNLKNINAKDENIFPLIFKMKKLLICELECNRKEPNLNFLSESIQFFEESSLQRIQITDTFQSLRIENDTGIFFLSAYNILNQQSPINRELYLFPLRKGIFHKIEIFLQIKLEGEFLDRFLQILKQSADTIQFITLGVQNINMVSYGQILEEISIINQSRTSKDRFIKRIEIRGFENRNQEDVMGVSCLFIQQNINIFEIILPYVEFLQQRTLIFKLKDKSEFPAMKTLMIFLIKLLPNLFRQIILKNSFQLSCEFCYSCLDIHLERPIKIVINMQIDDSKKADWLKVFKQLGELKWFQIDFYIDYYVNNNIDFIKCQKMYERFLLEKRIAVMQILYFETRLQDLFFQKASHLFIDFCF